MTNGYTSQVNRKMIIKLIRNQDTDKEIIRLIGF